MKHSINFNSIRKIAFLDTGKSLPHRKLLATYYRYQNEDAYFLLLPNWLVTSNLRKHRDLGYGHVLQNEFG